MVSAAAAAQAALARRGYDEAVARYTAAKPLIESDEHAVLIPVVEALWWACALDERFERIYTSYRQKRLDDQQCGLLRGLRYVRNRCGHEQALAVAHDEARWPIRFPVVFGPAVRWRRAGDLPPAEKPDAPGEQNYERRLADAVDQTIERVTAWFDAIEANPPT